MIDVPDFVRCPSCEANAEECASCVHNQALLRDLHAEREALIKVYVIAARLRTFPVPLEDHFQLVGAVDECRSVLEPPIDDYGPSFDDAGTGQDAP